MSWWTQSNDDGAKVQVSVDYNKDGPQRTDFLVIDKSTGEHAHYSVGAEPGDSDLTQHHDYDRN